MKKVLLFLVALVAFGYSAELADTVISNTEGLLITPNNVVSLELFDGVGDTITDSSFVTFGPYRMCGDRNEPMYKSFTFFSDSLGGTSPVAAIAYQVTPVSDNLNNALWTTCDTLDAVGAVGSVDMSSLTGKYIWFKVHNYDATSDVMGSLIINFKKDE